jgi:hypothetical protein
MKDNITYFFSETYNDNDNDDEANLNLTLLLSEFDELNNQSFIQDQDQELSELNNYELNFTNKQLLIICEYYNLLTKELRKMKKKDLIIQIMMFENDMNNIDIVIKRKNMWNNINELKNDKIMSRYIVLW